MNDVLSLALTEDMVAGLAPEALSAIVLGIELRAALSCANRVLRLRAWALAGRQS